jgi:hypothetical protein
MTRSRDVADTQDNLGGAVAPFVAGKNKIINGDFTVAQRGTSFSNPATGAFSLDRWSCTYGGAITTWAISQQSFTPGAAPVAGYESPFFYRSSITTIGTGSDIDHGQKIEDVRTFAGQTVTLSFYAKADSSRTSLIYFVQVFGTGGSGAVVTSTTNISVTTSWQRFSATFAIPSISGKTVGTGSYLLPSIRQVAASGSVLDIWGVQVEAGNVATPFTTASGSLGGELALCQRYYFRTSSAVSFGAVSTVAWAQTASLTEAIVRLPVTMRTTPTTFDGGTVSNTSFVNYQGNTFTLTGGATIAANQSTSDTVKLLCGSSGMTAGHVGNWGSNASGYAGFGAEL